MTMSMLPAYFSSTNYGRRKGKAKSKSKSQIQAEIEHAKYLKKMGIKGISPNEKRKAIPGLSYGSFSLPTPSAPSVECSNTIPGGVAAKPKPMEYSGENKLVGIATMHKSNMVPVFASNKEKAKEISSMRR
jgi:hypothetical protein